MRASEPCFIIRFRFFFVKTLNDFFSQFWSHTPEKAIDTDAQLHTWKNNQEKN
jgi:hypothetical protein